MARRKIQIDDALKKVICTRYDEGMDRKEILRHLIDRYHFRISLSVLKRYLKAWGKARYKVISSKEDIYRGNLKAIIMDLFVNRNATDHMILVDMESRGLPISPRQLQRLRLEMGLKRRHDDKNAGLQDAEIVPLQQESPPLFSPAQTPVSEPIMAEETPKDPRIANFLDRNATFAQTYKSAAPFSNLLSKPSTNPHIVIITCFDGRVDPRNYFGLQPEDAVFISNAGGRINADALRNIAILDNLLKVATVIVVHHTDCGLMHTSNESIRARLKQRAPERAGEIDEMDFELFKDVHESIKHDMGVVKASPYLDVQVLGYVYDVTSGTVEEIKI